MNVTWTPEDTIGAPVPASVLDYLINHGLPETIPFTTLEFGPSEAPEEPFVIGCDYDWPVVLDRQGIVLVLYEPGPHFFNSSVQILAKTVEEYLKLKECAEEESALGAERFRLFLSANDPKTLDEKHSVWRSLIEDFENMTT